MSHFSQLSVINFFWKENLFKWFIFKRNIFLTIYDFEFSWNLFPFFCHIGQLNMKSFSRLNMKYTVLESFQKIFLFFKILLLWIFKYFYPHLRKINWNSWNFTFISWRLWKQREDGLCMSRGLYAHLDSNFSSVFLICCFFVVLLFCPILF